MQLQPVLPKESLSALISKDHFCIFLCIINSSSVTFIAEFCNRYMNIQVSNCLEVFSTVTFQKFDSRKMVGKILLESVEWESYLRIIKCRIWVMIKLTLLDGNFPSTLSVIPEVTFLKVIAGTTKRNSSINKFLF